VIQPYRGYGSRQHVYLIGRVFRQLRFGMRLAPGTIFREVLDVIRRLARWGLGDVTACARFGETECRVATDGDGYFHIDMTLDRPPDPGECWHTVELEVTHGGETATAEGLVYIPPPQARLVVISDIDDTVMYTGVANKAKMLWRLFVQDAEARVAFPGVAALLRGLHDGPGGDEGNPMLYVSRAPWSIYEVLATFFRLKRIPEGPMLFLREWGLTLQRPLPRRARAHKRDLIEGMLERYPDLPFLLIGDSGQHDPEVYSEIVREHSGRVRAVYIRNVNQDEARAGEIAALATESVAAGCPLILALDSKEMAEHAFESGFLTEEALRAVAEEYEADVASEDGRSPGRGMSSAA
jgi:phosphatidate phosphatase APP1